MQWKSVCCAVQGRGHIRRDLPCQDCVARLEVGGVHVIALADGAGSAAMSHFGAQRVVDCAAEFVAEKFFDIVAREDGRSVTQELLTIIRCALQDESNLRGCELRDLASTLLLAAVSDEKFFLAHLGDGVIGYLSDAGLKVASTPDNGEFSNETGFVTSADAALHMRIFRGTLKKICAFVLMSDGTEQSLYNKRNRTLAPVIKRLMHRTCLVDGEVLTLQLRHALQTVVAENTRDDCSIALLAKNSAQLPPLERLLLFERRELERITDSPNFRRVRQKISRCKKISDLLKRPLTLRQFIRRRDIL